MEFKMINRGALIFLLLDAHLGCPFLFPMLKTLMYTLSTWFIAKHEEA
jgi:hypothetical protein